MDVRNIAWCDDGLRINCEINHPTYGWIEFTAAPDGDTSGIFSAILRGDHGPIAPAPPPPEPTAVELRETARARVREDYIKSPPSTDAERIRALEIIMGLREPEIEEGGPKSPPMRD